jgi:glyoxalase family protein
MKETPVKPLTGIHHVTAICGAPQPNVDFYSGVLGLRLVKKTVNFDDPGSYHLYYGDRVGTPGTLVTFFSWPGTTAGRPGSGEPVVLALAIPKDSASWWKDRLAAFDVPVEDAGPVLGEYTISFPDPEGLRIELVETALNPRFDFWPGGGILAKYAIQGVHSVKLSISSEESSADFYRKTLGFREAGVEDLAFRFAVGAEEAGGQIQIVKPLSDRAARLGAGSIHHLAFRTDDFESQRAWRKKLSAVAGVSDVMDRNYFESIYFREPGHVLFEIATDGPGMAIDEPVETLGESLRLPVQYERFRSRLESTLPPISLPQLAKAAAQQ